MKKLPAKKKPNFFFIKKGIHFKNIKAAPEKTIFDFCQPPYEFKNLELALLGAHQAENCSLALSAVSFFSQRDSFSFDEKKIRQTLKKAHFAGRLEILKVNGQMIILDGAHNPQKIAVLAKNLKKFFPGQKFNFLIAFKKKKDFAKALPKIIPLAEKIYLTRFFQGHQDWLALSEGPEKIKKVLKKLKFENFEIAPDPQKVIGKKNYQPLVVTGSLYLLSEIYPFIEKLKRKQKGIVAS